MNEKTATPTKLNNESFVLRVKECIRLNILKKCFPKEDTKHTSVY